MKLTHRTRTQEKSKTGTDLFMLSNRKGGYLFLGNNNFSHYAGLTFMMPDEWTLFKTLDAIYLDKPFDEVVNKFYAVERKSQGSSEQFRLFNKTLFYEVQNYDGGITIDLDMRRIYDFSSDDRHYHAYYEGGVLFIEYRHHGEVFYLVMSGSNDYELLDHWESRTYPYDASRGQQDSAWVYRALRVNCKGSQRLAFTFGTNKEQVKRDAYAAWDDWDSLEKKMKTHAKSIKTTNGIAYSTATFALESCLCSLNHGVDRTGLFAGYPWFFHFWARDELISLKAIILAEKFQLAKDILWYYLSCIQDDGRLPNMMPAVERGSADAIGWLWKRLADLVLHLQKNNLLWNYLSQEDIEFALSKLEDSLDNLKRHHEEDGLITNASQETWMDTLGEVNDQRKGARVEIQALTLASLKAVSLLRKILKKPNGMKWKEWEKSLRIKTQEVLFSDGMLWDGFDADDGGLDRTIRSNLFIAAYVYPELLTKKQWKVVFDRALDALWCEWGGISSLDKTHPWFVPNYDARNERSYHRGDSWFWVNNLAALAMKQISPEQHAASAERIIDASVAEMLWAGLAGHCAEVSSAQSLTSSGCFAQAWSAATLVELLYHNISKE